MIKLMDLLLEVKLSPEEREKFQQALAILKGNTLDEGIMDTLKKLTLTTTTILALLASPQLSDAQKKPLEDLIKQTTTATTGTRIGTEVDGKIGQYTSMYKFPLRATDTLTTVNIKNGEVIKKSTTGKEVPHQTTIKTAAQHGINFNQMKEWNKFVDWMNNKKYAGNEEMNKASVSRKAYDEYMKTNPEFWVKWEKGNDKSEDVEKVQKALQVERDILIDKWETENSLQIVMSGERMDPKNPEHVKRVKQNFMPIVKPAFYKS